MSFFDKYRHKIQLAKMTIVALGILILGISMILSHRSLTALGNQWNEEFDFVAGKYGKHCYISGHENKSIKYPVVFDTLGECVDFVSDRRK